MLVDIQRAPQAAAVDLTIDGLLVLAHALDIDTTTFPLVLAVNRYIYPDEQIRERVWADVRERLAVQSILEGKFVDCRVARMFETVTRPQRTLEGRWWRTNPYDHSKYMVRFAICRRRQQHVITARNNAHIVIHPITTVSNLADMLTAVIKILPAADINPISGPTDKITAESTPDQLTKHGADPRSARILHTAAQQQTDKLELVATETLPGGSIARPEHAVEILDSPLGRIVKTPIHVGAARHTAFTAGSRPNLHRALRDLVAFLPTGTWE